MDKVSIITAVYNTDKDLINRALLSVLNQSYTHYEWIIVNDGSNQDTANFLDDLADKYNFIKCIHQENKGTGTAKYTAFTQSTGEYITYLDSDDCLHKDYIKSLIELSKENNTQMSVVSFELVDNTFTPSNSSLEKKQTEIIDFNNYIQRLSGEYQVLYATLWGKLFKRELFDNIIFPIGYMIDDEPIIHQLAFNAENIAVNYIDLYYYTKMQNSVMNTSIFKEYKLELIDIYKDRINFVKRKTNDDTLVWILQNKYINELFALYNQAIKSTQNKDIHIKKIKSELKSILKTAKANPKASKKILLKAYIKHLSL